MEPTYDRRPDEEENSHWRRGPVTALPRSRRNAGRRFRRNRLNVRQRVVAGV